MGVVRLASGADSVIEVLMIFLDSAYPVLSCVLGYAALAKLGRFGEFAGQIEAYRLLPARLSRPVAVLVVGVELGVAGLLLPSSSRTVGAVVAVILFGVFLVAQAGAVARGLRIDCGCFSASGEATAVGPVSLVRTALLLGLALAAVAAGGAAFQPIQLLVAPLLAALVGLVPELVRLMRRPAETAAHRPVETMLGRSSEAVAR
ncbi:MAG TPA: MauE/DoxX family redox-associated membrane protein [Pseudonocardiaceae bacterium]|nr:MauE/DoxX family redox-associated membrane protein [Pseudonocardiaceae bacterium]